MAAGVTAGGSKPGSPRPALRVLKLAQAHTQWRGLHAAQLDGPQLTLSVKPSRLGRCADDDSSVSSQALPVHTVYTNSGLYLLLHVCCMCAVHVRCAYAHGHAREPSSLPLHYLPTPRPQILGDFSLERGIAAAATATAATHADEHDLASYLEQVSRY